MPSMKLRPSRPAAACTFFQCASASRRRVASSSTHFPRISARPPEAEATCSISASLRVSPSSVSRTSKSSSASVPSPAGVREPTVTWT